jgi:hypothetical protein
MRPVSSSEGHDSPRLIDKLVPGLTVEGDDLALGFEDAMGEPIFAHDLPDVFDRIELRCFEPPSRVAVSVTFDPTDCIY